MTYQNSYVKLAHALSFSILCKVNVQQLLEVTYIITMHTLHASSFMEQEKEKLTLLSLAQLPLQLLRTWLEFKASHCLPSNLWPDGRPDLGTGNEGQSVCESQHSHIS